jgi:hypothetical protein
MILKAVEQISRAPFTDISGRLRILADEIGSDVESVIVVCYPEAKIFGYGRALTRAELVGVLMLAAHDLMTAD